MRALICCQIHEVLPLFLTEKGIGFDHRPNLSYDECKDLIADYQILILRSKMVVDRELITAAKNLLFVGRLGSGMENVDTTHLEKQNIPWANSPDGNCTAVGEHALGMILALSNNLTKSTQELKEGIWKREENRGDELSSKILGIIGFGHTGSALAGLFVPFGTRVLAYDKYKFDFGSNEVEEVSLKQLQQESDILSIHLPLTEETHQMVDGSFIKSFQKKIMLINTSRGPILHMKSVVNAYKAGRVTSLGLDVFETEPISIKDENQKLEIDFFRDAENVVLSPHVAGWSHQSEKKMAASLLRKMEEAKVFN